MKQWTEERCAERPAELLLIAPSLYIQRRNIQEVTHEETEDQAAYTEYVCESREITESEYALLQSVEEIQTDKAVTDAIDQYTAELIEEGVLA
jgi:hypothetical protein